MFLRISRSLLAASLLLLLAAHPSWSQETRISLFGHVRDATGGALQGASLKLSDPLRGSSIEVVTDASGHYRILSVAPGTYRVSAGYTGFATMEKTVVLGIGQDSIADFVLKIGGLNTETEVVAPDVPASPGLGARVAGETIRSMPLDGRDLARLVLLQPGVTWTRSSLQTSATGHGTRFSVGGAAPYQNSFVMDGTVVNDALGHTPGSAQGLLLGVDSVEEFRVMTGVLGAEHGRASGGVFLAVTRSGTNAWRGSAFEFFRNDALDAKAFFDRTKPSFTRNQFGASLGGPLKKDRTFLFATYEGLRQDKGITQTALVPDHDARRGIVAGVNVGLDPRATPLLALYPAPNGRALGGGAAEYSGVLNQASTANFATVKLDHRFSGVDSVFLRYMFENSLQDTPRAFPQSPTLSRNTKQVLTGAGQKGLPGGGIVSLRFGVSKSRPDDEIVPVDTTVQLVTGQPFGEINVPGLSDFGTDRAVPARFEMLDTSSTLTVTLPNGAHLFKGGASVERFDLDGLYESRTRGQLRFRSISDFVRFRVQDLQAASSDSDFKRRHLQWAYGAFVQDEWRVNSRLRVDVGLRWEHATGPIEKDGKSANLRNIMDTQVTIGGPLFEPPAFNLAPRVGAVWNVSGDGRTVVRGGVGVFNDLPLFHFWRASAFRGLPYANRGRLTVVPALPIPGELFASAERSTDSFEYELKRTWLLRWSGEISHEFRGGITGTLGYAGSSGHDLLSIADVNTAFASSSDENGDFYREGSTRRNPAFDTLRRVQGGYSSNFKSFDATVSRSAQRGLTFQGNYRLAYANDNVAGFGDSWSSNGQTRSLDPYRKELDYGPSNFDVRHSVGLRVSYRPAWDLGGMWGQLFNDWAIDSAFQFASGEPFTPVVEGDPDRDGTDQNPARPDLVPGVPLYPSGGSTSELWFNPAAFAPPTPGRRGTAPRGVLRSPSFKTIDVALSRRFAFGGAKLLEVRLEGFNIVNWVNLAQPVNSGAAEAVFVYVPPSGTTPATFTVPGGVGRIFSIQGTARELQLGVRFSF